MRADGDAAARGSTYKHMWAPVQAGECNVEAVCVYRVPVLEGRPPACREANGRRASAQSPKTVWWLHTSFSAGMAKPLSRNRDCATSASMPPFFLDYFILFCFFPLPPARHGKRSIPRTWQPHQTRRAPTRPHGCKHAHTHADGHCNNPTCQARNSGLHEPGAAGRGVRPADQVVAENSRVGECVNNPPPGMRVLNLSSLPFGLIPGPPGWLLPGMDG